MLAKKSIKMRSLKARLLGMLKAKCVDAKSSGRNEISAKVDIENIVGGYTGKLTILIDDVGIVGIFHIRTDIPMKSRSRVGEYYLRINSILKRGVIGLDYENGETRFRNAMSKLDFEKAPEEELTWFLRMPMLVLARFMPQLKKLVNEKHSPKCVFKECISDLL